MLWFQHKGCNQNCVPEIVKVVEHQPTTEKNNIFFEGKMIPR